MKYTEARQGRIFVARFEDGEDLLQELKDLIKKENITAGIVHLIGALANTKVVLGPVKRAYPPDPFFWEFDDAREIFGLGIFAWENDEPKIHLHSGIGHKSESKVGCIRKKSEIYLVVEAIIQEITGSHITRKLDDRYNASLIDF